MSTMSEGGANGHARLGADVILEFEKSIRNVQQFASVMEELDARFGRLDQRVEALRSSLSALSTQVSRGAGSQLRRSIEQELNNIAQANGVVLTSVGTSPFKIKQETVRHIFRRIDAELNRAIARSIADINIKLDSNFYSGQFTLGKSEFAAFNSEVARLIKTHVSNLTRALRQSGAEIISSDQFKGLELDIGRQTVKEIMQSVKRQLIPIIANPEVPVEGVNFRLSPREVQNLVNRIKQQINAVLEVNLDSLGDAKGPVQGELRSKMLQAKRQIDAHINAYVEGIRRSVATLDTASMEVPLRDMTRSLKKYIARDLGVSVQKLEKTFETLTVGETTSYELRRQFSSLERVINSKLRTGTSQIMTELKRSVRAVEIQPQPRLKHYLISEINKLHNEIVKKIREQIDKQFAAMRAEVQTINTMPKQIRRSGRIRSMAEGYAKLEGAQVRPYASHLPPVPPAPQPPRQLDPRFGTDPYARRDAYFSTFGLQGAIINTIRHIMAGGIVGTPIMLAYSALDAFKTSQLEQVKMFQNLMLKDQYKDDEGNIMYAQVETDIKNELVPAIKELSLMYGITYDEMSKAATIGTRSLNSPEEVRQFLDYAATIQRLDSEGDLAEVVAPGLEAIKNQFNMSVWHLDEAVQGLAVAANRTKATTEDIIQALQRSGSGLYMAGLDVKDASALSSIFLHYTGLSGSDIGNMLKTLAARLGMPTHVRKLEEEFGIQIYERDANGVRKQRDLIDILTDIANLSVRTNMDEQELAEILFSQAGGFQINKLKAGIEAFADPELSISELNYHQIREQMDNISAEEIDRMLANTLFTTFHNINRAGTAVQASLVELLEKMSPEINRLMQNITNLAEGFRENADLVKEIIHILGSALVGYGAMLGTRKLAQVSGYNEILERTRTVDRIVGQRGWRGEIIKEGNMSQFSSALGKDLASELSNRKFLETAMKNEALAPLVAELANMDERRLNEFKNYLEHNKPKGMDDFFMAIRESKGFQPPEKLSAEDLHNRAAHNARMLAQSKALATVMSSEFIKQLERMGDTSFFNEFTSVPENRRFANQLARMSDTELRAYEQYLIANHATQDRRITSTDRMRESLDSFRKEQARLAEEARRNTPAFMALSSAIEKTRSEMSKPVARAGQNSFITFLNDLPNKARSGITALGNLSRSIGRFAAQLGLMFAVGDVISSTVSHMALTDQERAHKELEIRSQTAEEYIYFLEKMGGSWLGSFTSLETLIKGEMWNWNIIRNAITPGVHGVSRKMIYDFDKEFKEWLKENYGSTDIKRVVQQEDKELQDLVNEFVASTGLHEELQESARELFRARELQARLDEEFINRMKEQADREKMEQELLRELNSQGHYFTKAYLREELELLNQEIFDELKLRELEALLRGIKTYSDEYFNLQKQRLQGELDNQKQILDGLREFIESHKENMRILEEEGKRWVTDPETGERVESQEYRISREAVERESQKLAELQKEFRSRELELKVELQTLERNRVLAQVDKAVADITHVRQMTEFANSLNLDRNTKEYIDAQIEAQREYVNSLKMVLEDLKAKDLVDPNDELKRRIMSLEETIASAEVAMKDLALRRITGYRHDLERFDIEQEIDYLRAQVGLRTTDSSHPVLRQLRMSQGNERRLELERIMAELRAEMESETNPEIIEAYQRELLQLERESLRVQLNMLEELRGEGGTFNVPDGLRVMTEYEYMRSLGTHTSYSFGMGDMNVQIVLPNITNATTPEQMKIIAESISIGMMNGRLSSLRHMMTGGPWGYKAR